MDRLRFGGKLSRSIFLPSFLFIFLLEMYSGREREEGEGETEERGDEGYIRFRAIPISRFLGEKSPRGATRARINEASA